MSRRFYIPTPLRELTDGRVSLDGAEAHHLAHVMRAKPGDVVTLFDGRGCESEARIEAVGRRDVTLSVGLAREISRERPGELVLGVALPRGDRQEWLVEKAVELGVTRLVPLESEHSVARPNDKTLEKLRRVVIEASKQCGRNQLMEIADVQSLADYLTTAQGTRYFAHIPSPINSVPPRSTDAPQSEPHSTPTREHNERQAPSSGNPAQRVAAQAIHIAVGPEGGFTDEEAEQAAANGWQPISLGPRILRTETAALALAQELGSGQ